MKEVKRHIRELEMSEFVYVYKPTPLKVEGTFENGAEYSVVIRDSALPAGTAPSAATNLNLIAWDGVLYLLWDLPTGNYDSQKVYVNDANGLVDEIEINSKSLNELEIPENIVNGTQYTLHVSAVHEGGEVDSSTVSDTPVNKTPQNVTVSNGDTSLSVDWDDITTGFKEYNVYVYEKSSGDLEQHIKGLQLSEVEVIGLTNETTYEVEVSAVSELDLFESKAAKVEGTPSEVPDSPQNFNVEVNGALSFDGQDDYVDIGFMNDLDLSSFKIDFELSMTSTEHIRMTGTWNDGSDSTAFEIALNYNLDGNNEPNNLRFYVRGEAGFSEVSLSSTYDFTDGERHSFVLERTGVDTFKVIIDGNEQNIEYNEPSGGGSTSFNAFEYPVTFGTSNIRGTLNNSNFEGVLYNISYYSNGSLIREFLLDHSSSDTVAVDSTNNEDGTINGATWQDNAVSTWDEVLDIDGYNVYLSDDGGATYTKQNSSLISTLGYTIENLADGDYEAYSTSVRGGVESEPSNIETFTVGTPAYDTYRIEILSSFESADEAGLKMFALAETIGGPDIVQTAGGAENNSGPTSGWIPERVYNDDLGEFQGWGVPDEDLPIWSQWTFNEPKTIVEYTLCGRHPDEFGDRGAAEWKVYGREEGGSFELLDHQTTTNTWGNTETRKFEIQ